MATISRARKDADELRAQVKRLRQENADLRAQVKRPTPKPATPTAKK